MVKVAAIAVMLALLGMMPAAASAQDSLGKVEFERATRYFEAGEYDAALPYYQKAYELSKHRPSTIRALAQCERALRHYDDAITHLQEYLAMNPEDAPKIRETLALLEDLRAESKSHALKLDKPETPPTERPAAQASPAPSAPPPQPVPGPATSLAPNGGESLVTSQPPAEESPSLLSSPLFWGIAAGVAVVAGGIALGFALSGKDSPYAGNSHVTLTN